MPFCIDVTDVLFVNGSRTAICKSTRRGRRGLGPLARGVAVQRAQNSDGASRRTISKLRAAGIRQKNASQRSGQSGLVPLLSKKLPSVLRAELKSSGAASASFGSDDSVILKFCLVS